MKELLSNYENFAFRALTFHTRATPLEFWSVMPVIWLIIMWVLVGDMGEVYGFLIAREIPPLNPFYYESVLLFAVTLIPRMAVNIRRLHDRDRTGFWVLIPILTFVSSIVLVCGLLGAMMNSSQTGIARGPDELSNIVYPIALYFSNPLAFWEEMFSVARAFEKTGSDAIWNLLHEIYNYSGRVDIRRSVRDVSTAIEGNAGHTYGFIFVAGALLLTPFLSAAFHILLTVLPSSMEDNIYGPAKIGELHYTKKVSTEHNAMSGYKHLFEETKEEKERKRKANAQEVQSLYKTRVLGLTDD